LAEPLRVYIRRNSEYARLMWFHNNKPNEMVIGFYGLYQKQPILQGIEFIILTQTSDKYKMTTAQPQYPHIFFDHLDDHIFIIEGRFSGANYKELDNEVSGRLGQIGIMIAPIFRLDASTVRGLLLVQALRMSQDALTNRHDGTVIIFKFPIAPDKYIIKGFSIG
jgi:hypothetical protein